MNLYTSAAKKGVYIMEVSKEDAYLMAAALQDCIFEDSALHDRADRIGTQIQRRMEIEGDWANA